MKLDEIARSNKPEQLYPIMWDRTAIPNDRMLISESTKWHSWRYPESERLRS
jgi:hypothetical protein